MAGLSFVFQKSGLGQVSPNKDNYSGLLLYQDTLPESGITLSNRVKQYGSLAEMEQDGWIEGSINTGIGYYYAKNFFQLAPDAALFVGVFEVPVGAHDFAELLDVARFANREIRQTAIFTPKEYAASMVNAINTQLTTLKTEIADMVVVLGANMSAVSDITTLADLASGQRGEVVVCAAQDGGGEGKDLYNFFEQSVPALGSALGCMALANVSNSIAWSEVFNIATGTDMDTPAFANGVLAGTVSRSTIESIAAKGYLVAKKEIGIDGTFFQDSRTAAASTFDISTIENARTAHKAKRLIYSVMIGKLNGPLTVDPTNGNLSASTCGLFEATVNNVLRNMVANQELSGFQCVVPRNQNVLSTGKVVVNVSIIPIGVARQIQINLGFATKLV